MKPRLLNTARLSFPLAAALATLLSKPVAQADTFTWDASNVTGTPTALLDWFDPDTNPLGVWTGAAVPVSDPTTIIKFFANTTTNLPNTAVPSTQTVNLNTFGDVAFQLGSLELNGLGSTTDGASLTMTLQGDALNFSAATGTISFNSVKNVTPNPDPVINYTINNNIQLGTASSASALTINGSQDALGTTVYKIDGSVTELLGGGGSILKSGASIVTINGALSITGAVSVSAGQLNLTNNTNTASSLITNGGTLNVTGTTISATTMTANTGTLILAGVTNYTPASGSMSVNSGGILQLGNNTATTFGAAGVYSGNISTGTGGTLLIGTTSAQEFSGIISGSGGINKGRNGALTLSGSNTYTGKTVLQPLTASGGGAVTVNVSSFNYVTNGTWADHLVGSSLGKPTTVANGTIDVGSNSAQTDTTLNYTGSGETTDRVLNIQGNASSTGLITTSGGGLLKFTRDFTTSSVVKITLGGSGNGEIPGNIGVTSGTLTKAGSGTWTLSGTNGITGATIIAASGGILNLTSATALQNSPFDTASAVGGSAIGLRTTTTTLTLGGLTGSNALKGRFTTATGGPSNATANGGYAGLTNLTLNTVAGANLAYTGAVVEGATGMSLTKTGAGIQTLNATHTYTGTTFVNGGFLQLTGNTLTGGLSVSNGSLLSNSSFAGLSSVASGGVISPGASHGAIGTLTINNASASALTLNGSTSIFDLPASVTTPDRIAVTGGGGLVLTGTNIVLLQTPTTGVLPGTYDLMTFTGAPTGAGSLVFANGSTTMGNASLSVSAGLVQLTVGAGGLAGTTTYTGTGGTGNTNNWSTAAKWDTVAVPTGAVNITLAPSSGGGVTANDALVTAFTGNLTINPGVVLQLGYTTDFPAAYNALGTPGTSTIFLHAGSRINSRNGGTGTFSDIVLLGDATVSLGESTETAMAATFRSITGPYTFNLVTQSGNGATANSTLSFANSVPTLNISGGTASGSVSANAAGSIGSANVGLSSFAKLILNHSSAITDNANAIRINNGALEQGTGVDVTAALSLSTRPIELNGSGGATITNANTASSSAYTMTLSGGISSTATGAKTLTLGGANTGLNTISGIISNSAGTIALTKADAGTWVLSNANTYSGATTLSAGTLVLTNSNAIQNSALTISGGTLSLLHDTNNTTFANASTTLSATATINVHNNGSGTGNRLNLGAVNVSAATTATLTVTNGNSYALGLGSVTQSPTTATTLTIANAAPLTMASFSTNSTATPKLSFTGLGTATITGNITQSGSGALALERATAAGTLILQGTSNMTGAVTISNGTIQTAVATNAFGSTSGISIGASGILALRGDASAAFSNGTTNYPVTMTASGATINVDQASSAAPGTTLTLGTVAMGGLYTLNTTGANGVGLSLGAVTGSTANNKVINNSIASPGGLMIASYAETINSARTITFQGTGNTTVTGAITQNGANALALTNSGSGILTLNGTSSYTGITTINSGVVEAATLDIGGNNSSIGKSSNAAASLVFGAPTATLRYTGGSNVTIDRGFTLSSGTGGGATIESSGAGTLSFNNTVAPTYGTANQTRVLTLGGTNTEANTFGKVIANNTGTPTNLTSLVKAGAGKWILNQNNTYGGTTTISGGTLSVTGSLGASAVSVNAGTLSGNGNFGGNVSIASGATHAIAVAANPGAQDTTVITGTLTLTSGNILDLTAASTPAPGEYVLATATTAITGTPTTINYNGIPGTVTVDTVSNPKRLLLTVTTGTPYSIWAGTFLPSDVSNPALNLDGDTLTNLQEFAFGTNPTVSSGGSIVWVNGGAVTTPGVPVAINFANPGVDYRAVFGRRKDYVAAGLTYTVQFSAGLDVWVNSSTTPTVLTGAGGLNPSEIEAVSVPYPLLIDVGGNNFKKPTFFRVEVTN